MDIIVRLIILVLVAGLFVVVDLLIVVVALFLLSAFDNPTFLGLGGEGIGVSSREDCSLLA